MGKHKNKTGSAVIKNKTSLFGRIGFFFKRNPIRATFMTLGLVIGLAAFVTGSVLTGGALAGAAFATGGIVGAVFGGSTSLLIIASGITAGVGALLAGLSVGINTRPWIAKKLKFNRSPSNKNSSPTQPSSGSSSRQHSTGSSGSKEKPPATAPLPGQGFNLLDSLRGSNQGEDIGKKTPYDEFHYTPEKKFKEDRIEQLIETYNEQPPYLPDRQPDRHTEAIHQYYHHESKLFPILFSKGFHDGYLSLFPRDRNIYAFARYAFIAQEAAFVSYLSAKSQTTTENVKKFEAAYAFYKTIYDAFLEQMKQPEGSFNTDDPEYRNIPEIIKLMATIETQFQTYKPDLASGPTVKPS